jgi:hypothetical protein
MPRAALMTGGDVPLERAAQRMALSPQAFKELLPKLYARQFPPPDPDTGNFDLDAIDEWRRRRHPGLFLTARETPRDATAVFRSNMERLKQHG